MKNLNIPYEIVLVYFDHGTDLFPEVVNKKDLTKPLQYIIVLSQLISI